MVVLRFSMYDMSFRGRKGLTTRDKLDFIHQPNIVNFGTLFFTLQNLRGTLCLRDCPCGEGPVMYMKSALETPPHEALTRLLQYIYT